MSSIKFIGSTGNSDPGSSSITLTKPAGVINGDLLIAVLHSSSGAINGPAGWTEWTQFGNAEVAFKVASNESSSWQWTTFGPTVGVVLAYRGVKFGTNGFPQQEAGPTAGTVGSDVLSYAALTGVRSNSLLLRIGTVQANAGSLTFADTTLGGSYTKRHDAWDLIRYVTVHDLFNATPGQVNGVVSTSGQGTNATTRSLSVILTPRVNPIGMS